MMKNKIMPLAALGLILAAPTVHAQTQTVDPNIDKLLDQVVSAYHDLSAFSFTVSTKIANGTNERETVTNLKVKKPGMLSAEIVTGNEHRRVVCDGKTAYSDSSLDKTKYVQQPAAELRNAVNVLAQNGGGGVGLLPILLTNVTKQTLLFRGAKVTKLADENIGTEACDVVAEVVGEGDKARKYMFDYSKADHLLRQLTIGPATDNAKPAVVETYSKVNKSAELANVSFIYTPVSGAMATEPPKPKPPFDPRLKVGATPLAISGTDLDGKAVSLDQYKGKVVLIDFWATWCGPCVAELPNVIAAYNKYHDKGFEIVGISLDQANAKDKVTQFIHDKSMPWRQIYDGKYWEAGNAVAYGVQAIPFTLLIGTDGKIAAVGARGEALAPAIEAALKK